MADDLRADLDQLPRRLVNVDLIRSRRSGMNARRTALDPLAPFRVALANDRSGAQRALLRGEANDR
jgi:hypothetical protein